MPVSFKLLLIVLSCLSDMADKKRNIANSFWNTSYNLEQNTCRLFHFLVQFVFTTSETELDYYHQKVNIPVASQVAEQLKTYDLRKLGSFK